MALVPADRLLFWVVVAAVLSGLRPWVKNLLIVRSRHQNPQEMIEA